MAIYKGYQEVSGDIYRYYQLYQKLKSLCHNNNFVDDYQLNVWLFIFYPVSCAS